MKPLLSLDATPLIIPTPREALLRDHGAANRQLLVAIRLRHI